MRRVAIISKPLLPPWNDSGKNVARDLVTYSTRTSFEILTAQGVGAATHFPADVHAYPVYRQARTFGSRTLENARVALHLLKPSAAVINHFFFAPNRVSSSVARVIMALKRRKKTVQTILSLPLSMETLAPNLFADRVVAVSRHTARQIPGAICIPPGIPISAAPTLRERTDARAAFGFAPHDFVLLFPGDYEFSSAAETVASAAPLLLAALPHARIVFACRTKTERSIAIAATMRARFAASPRVTFAGEVPSIRSLLLASDVVALPAETTYAKIDLPLVLIESLEVGTPIAVGAIPPLAELVETSAGEIEHGVAIKPNAPDLFAGAIIKLATDASPAMREAARRVAVMRYDARAMAAAYENLYDDLLA